MQALIEDGNSNKLDNLKLRCEVCRVCHWNLIKAWKLYVNANDYTQVKVKNELKKSVKLRFPEIFVERTRKPYTLSIKMSKLKLLRKSALI